jgi:hypothetical protein
MEMESMNKASEEWAKHDLICVHIPVLLSLWHERLGHLSKAGINPKLSFSDYHSFASIVEMPWESSALDLVYSDISGLMPHRSLSGALYFITFIDEVTPKLWAYSTRTKDRVLFIFKEWLTMVENQMDRKFKFQGSKKKGEYKLDEFVRFYIKHGVQREYMVP